MGQLRGWDESRCSQWWIKFCWSGRFEHGSMSQVQLHATPTPPHTPTFGPSTRPYPYPWQRDNAALSTILGSTWKKMEGKKPTTCTEIFSAELAVALQTRQEFGQEEVDDFNLKDLKVDSFIKVGNAYYEQAAAPIEHSAMHCSVRYRLKPTAFPIRADLKPTTPLIAETLPMMDQCSVLLRA